ncbi:MAG: ATP-NAD kinase [Candidatus Altiarchaeales archaeon]|nr:MAG: ATP-NAD kinase [Candidatus Altiarchaeales archaeon]
MVQMKIGFLINPIAGMGGRVGLKGTDNLVEEAIRLGAKPIARERARLALGRLKNLEIEFITCSGEMGGSVLKEMNFNYRIVYRTGEKTTADDTKNACREFLKNNVELILFCGGDGTARDIFSVVDKKIPILGIPAGVKMYSSVFAINPKSAGEILKEFLADRTKIRDAEIMDIDEEKFRENILDVRLFGYARIPYKPILIQMCKSVSYESEERNKENIAKFCIEFMRDGALYILGAGTTVKKISDLLGIEKTLLGVDIVKDGKLLAKDVNEKQILKILDKEERAYIIVSPIGAQGFIFGRGNQQIGPRVIRSVGVENIIIIATNEKLSQLPYLFVDTGDEELDKELSGYRQVICDYHLAQRRKVCCGILS